MTDFDDEGNYAWKKGAYAASAYRYSEKAAPHKHLKDYNKVLQGEHVIPLSMVFKRWLEIVDEGAPTEDQPSSNIFSRWCGSRWPSNRRSAWPQHRNKRRLS
ncbi:MAG: hypothetical protein ACPGGE_06535 [Poseidonia sp.]